MVNFIWVIWNSNLFEKTFNCIDCFEPNLNCFFQITIYFFEIFNLKKIKKQKKVPTFIKLTLLGSFFTKKQTKFSLPILFLKNRLIPLYRLSRSKSLGWSPSGGGLRFRWADARTRCTYNNRRRSIRFSRLFCRFRPNSRRGRWSQKLGNPNG